MVRKFLSFLLDTTQTIVISLSIFVIIYLFLARPTEVMGYSMEPYLENNDRLVVESVSYYFEKPKRGDVVVVHSPVVSDVDYIKRVVGISGDSITIKDCKIFINNDASEQVLAENYLGLDTCTHGGSRITENQNNKIPDGYYLVMGDNREHSFDGRFFGLVPKSSISGKAFIRYWPPEKWKIF